MTIKAVTIKAIIVEDSRLARLELKEQLKAFPQIELIAEAKNAFEGQKVIEQQQPDLIFLDIQMKKGTGFEGKIFLV